MDKQNQLKMGAEQKRWQDSQKYAETKADLRESQVQETEMISEYKVRQKRSKKAKNR